MSIESVNLHLNATIEGALQELVKKIEHIRNPSASKVIYSAILGGYDSGYDVVDARSDTDCILFYDNKKPVVNGWVLQKLNFSLETPQRTAKLLKVLPHLIFPMYMESIWIDANRVFKKDLYAIAELAEDAKFAMFAHHRRSSVEQEVRECVKWRKDRPGALRRQYEKYTQAGFRDNVGLFCGAFMYRRHMDPKIMLLMQRWWSEITTGSIRDQISLPYCCWASDVYPKIIFGNVNNNCYFTTIMHVKPYANDGSTLGLALAFLSKFMGKIGRLRLVRKIRGR